MTPLRALSLTCFAAATMVTLAGLTGGCGDVLVDPVVRGGAGGIGPGDSGPTLDGTTLEGGPQPPGFCSGAGPLVRLPQGSCTGDIGRRSFLFALCACNTGQMSGTLKTDSFNSLGTPTSKKTASIGLNGTFQSNARLDLGGSLWAGGSGGTPAVTLKNGGAIATELRAGGLLRTEGAFRVEGDIYARGGVEVVSGGITSSGRLHVPAGAPTGGVTAAGGTVIEPVELAPPCNCGRALDVGGIVRSFANANDNATTNVSPSALTLGGTNVISLDCGKYYFDAVSIDAVTLKLGGRTAIFVGGNATIRSALKVELAPTAELDLFIAGNLELKGTTLFGATGAPARVRVYVGGTGVTVVGQAGIGANLYAPNAALEFASAYEMSGAIFARSFQFAGDFTVHYDEAVLDAQGCEPPGNACQTCDDCPAAAPACKNGTCGACAVTADCCAPLVCRSGKCVPDIR